MRHELISLLAAAKDRTDEWMAGYAAERIRALAETAEDPKHRQLARLALANLGR